MRHRLAAYSCAVTLALGLLACGDNRSPTAPDADLDGTSCTPIDDDNECTTDICENGVPVNNPVAEGTTCATGACNATGECVAPSCTDGTKNGDETDVDCGGSCAPVLCADGGGCVVADDCESGVCTGMVCQAPACGDGVMQAGEMCDDGNQTNDDGCDDGTGGTCRVTGCGNGTVAGTEVCDDGNADNGDGCDNNCTVSACGNGVTAGAETCDDGNTMADDGCSDVCATEPGFTCTMTVPSVCSTTCGDGVIAGTETCDQGGGNVTDGDGCSAACAVEAGFECTGTPSVCTALCGNGVLDAGEQCDDGNPTSGDGCDATCQFEVGCAAGETTVVLTNATSTPIPDNNPAGVLSPVSVTATGAVTKAIVYIDRITHTFDSDLDLSLVGPSGLERDLSSDNGGGGDNYVRTFLDDAATTSIVSSLSSAAPFTGRFIPEQSLTTTAGSDFRALAATGTWSLKAVDDASTDAGTLESWTLLLCVDPAGPACGDGIVNGVEECDDGNTNPADGCDNLCQRSCGNGVVTAGEQCDDGNEVSGDGCSATCEVDIACAAGQTPVILANNIAFPIPDNDATGISSTVDVATVGAVTKVVAFLGDITHPNATDLDMFLVGPSGVRRELSTDNGGSGDDYRGTYLDDAATISIITTSSLAPPFTGRFRPEQSLSTTAGVDYLHSRGAGTWTLNVADDATNNVGTLNSWTLLACIDPAATFCGDGVINGGEECDDGNLVDTDACSNLCQIVDGCGDGNLDPGEECDDNNVTSGDGCSASCQLELGCAAGETQVVVSASDVPLPIPDDDPTGSSSVINVGAAGTVMRAVVVIDSITHTFDADLDISLISPMGTVVDLSSDNGGAGDDYVSTILDDTAATPITAGTAPFRGRFRPEAPLAGVATQPAAGAWTLKVVDDLGGDTGVLNAWTLGLCVQ